MGSWTGEGVCEAIRLGEGRVLTGWLIGAFDLDQRNRALSLPLECYEGLNRFHCQNF